MNWTAILWLVLMVFFLMAEGVSVMVVSLWFAAGSLVAMIASLCGADFWLQALLFFVVSIALLLSLRPLAQKFFTPKITKTNVDAIVGMQGIVLTSIDNVTSQGRVKVGSMEWSARSTDGSLLPEGTQVVVDRVEGVKLFVSPIPVKTGYL